MAKYEKYAEYKDSGVEWLEDVPKEWDIIKIKHLSSVKRGASPRPIDDPKYFDDNGEYAWVRIADVSASDTYLLNTPQTMSELGSSLSVKLEPNELFLSIAGTVGKPCINKIKACIHDGFVYFPELKIPNKFLFYVFAGEQAYKGLGKMGTQLNLNTDTVGDIKVALPKSIDDIQNIVDFLDHETAKIDTLIGKQEKLIELLKEKRQAVISHAVTKGLNPDVAMKDSGVEWLGQVPEHWVTLPLKLGVETRKGVAFKAVDFCDFGIRVVKASDIKQKTIRESDVFLPEKYLTEYPKAILKEGDLVLSTVGSTPDVKNSAVGQIGKVPKNLNNSLLNQNTVVFSAKKNLDQNFLFYVVQADSYRDHLDLHAHGTANQASLNIENMLDFKISIPDLKEQKEITSYLDKKMSEYEKLELQSLEIIYLMIERRTALISSAVTGKINVTNWQNPNHNNNEANTELGA
ncbi:restriction endonuclease subunit S [Acinetobacter faecalis]|uniref:restriction endonuclease subunit S n=1 Tax=Acinetobacter faecalis TaxID=2665161 RepID=UPI002A912809|nr:restriction endonuclease subunit S [Acinetobacter faecalis]MDY6536602.1 restriction endonuclease subunit S [Acinetobacter faecalis]